jgi:excisionase family DNA binding protein
MTDRNEDDLKFLTLGEAADLLRVSRRSIVRVLKRNKISAFKIGGQWRIPEGRFRQWVHEEQNRVING